MITKITINLEIPLGVTASYSNYVDFETANRQLLTIHRLTIADSLQLLRRAKIQ